MTEHLVLEAIEARRKDLERVYLVELDRLHRAEDALKGAVTPTERITHKIAISGIVLKLGNKKEKYERGDIVILKKEFVGYKAGSVCRIYNTYKDEHGKPGYDIEYPDKQTYGTSRWNFVRHFRKAEQKDSTVKPILKKKSRQKGFMSRVMKAIVFNKKFTISDLRAKDRLLDTPTLGMCLKRLEDKGMIKKVKQGDTQHPSVYIARRR